MEKRKKERKRGHSSLTRVQFKLFILAQVTWLQTVCRVGMGLD